MADNLSLSQVEAVPEPQILFETRTVFPFDFFPHKIRLTSVAISLNEQLPLGESQSNILMIKDIMNIESSTGILFGTLRLSPRMPTIHPLVINYVANADVNRLKNLIQGLMILDSQQVKTSSAEPGQVQRKAESVGQVTAN